MSSMKTVAVAGFAMCICAAHSYTADMAPPLLFDKPAMFAASGWYLRGDAAYRFNRINDTFALIAPDPTNNVIDDRFAFGGGAGYKTGWLRIDGTVDFSSGNKYSGSTPFAALDYTAKVDAVTALLNAYFDLGTWGGFTPYVGVGLGGSRLRVSDFASVSLPASSGANSQWNFTWALMGGASYNVAANLALDVGYRYVNLGDAKSALDSVGNQLTLKGLSAHEIRFGARWSMF